MGLVIRGGTVVNAGERFTADVKIEGRTITGIGAGLARGSGDTEIDAAGRCVVTGSVDPNVHMELPFMGTVSIDDFETGTASGIAGGTTSIIDFCIPAPGTSLLHGLKTWKERTAKATADYSFHMAITGWGENTANEMRAVVRDHGITSFKVFMAYKGAIMVDDHALYQVMKVAAETGAVVTVHAENGDAVWNLQQELLASGCTGPEYPPVSRPSAVEGEATERALMMVRLHGAPPYIVHMTCRESVQALERAKLSGQKCYGETCPQYLLLDDRVLAAPDFGGSAHVMSPPIPPRGLRHHAALWAGG